MWICARFRSLKSKTCIEAAIGQQQRRHQPLPPSTLLRAAESIAASWPRLCFTSVSASSQYTTRKSRTLHARLLKNEGSAGSSG